MIISQQSSSRPLVVALTQLCNDALGMAPTKCLDVKCGGFTVTRGSVHNILNILRIACLHSHANSRIYPMRHFKPLFCTHTLGMAPTECLYMKCGGFNVSRGSVHNILNILPIACLHSHPKSRIFPMKRFTPLFRKQTLNCLSVSSTMPMVHYPDSDDCRSGDTIVPSVLRQLEKLNIMGNTCQLGQFNRLLCPQCGGGSTRERSFIVFIFPDGNCAMWQCFRAECNWIGITMGTPMSAGPSTPKLNTLASKVATSNNGDRAIRNFTEEYLKLEPLCDELCDYFASRMISRETLQRNGVMQVKRNNQIVIAFTYRRNGKIVNCKYRDVQKRFSQEKNTEKIPYGLDDIKEARDIIIVEGEFDKLCMEEAGYRNCISVPNGAPSKVLTKGLPPVEQDKSYEYLWNSKEYFDQASRIILATDADEPGQVLAEELARRLGCERCWRVTWPRRSRTENQLYKDANECSTSNGDRAAVTN